MEIPVINMKALDGDKRSETMSLLHDACAKWGFFWVENHGVDDDLFARVTKVVNSHYETHMKEEFYKSDVAKELSGKNQPLDIDWESSFFLRHPPSSNENDNLDVDEELRNTMHEYVEKLVKMAETLAEMISENLGLEKDHLKKLYNKPFVGTKVAKYPQCPNPGLVSGFRAHTDAGGIIMLLQDDTVPGLEFLKDGEWVPINPTKESKIFVNIGDQIEVISNGVYKSIVHRVLADKEGSRFSIVTFYNPGLDSVITPATKLLYPSKYSFQEYLDYYFKTKFSDKDARLQSMKMMMSQ